MSPDDVFAAQFWPWPDPAIKRDPQGRVLFVNAAFLALYGGRVEDWRGNAVGGWAAPQPPINGQLTPYRFETHLRDETGTDHVYDWIEQILADGNAFALARDVTVFTYAPNPDPGETHPAPPVTSNEPAGDGVSRQAVGDHAPAVQTPEVQAPTVDASATEVPATQALTMQTPVSDPYAPEAASHHGEPVLQLQPSEAPIASPPQSQNPTLASGLSDQPAIPNIPIPDVQITDDEAYALTQPVEQNRVEQTTTPELSANQDAPREFERRALPLEAESAVLGNNWRDAVIARAVGVEEATPVAEEIETPEENVSAESSESVRILLAEDNAINALLTRTLLEADGHTVETVEDGILAVEAMKAGAYDLIFMDMRMPNMDGLEATRKIRTLPNVSRDLPIIALTANAFDDDRNACFDSGMNDFMTKPVSAEELSEMVVQWTGSKAQQRLAS